MPQTDAQWLDRQLQCAMRGQALKTALFQNQRQRVLHKQCPFCAVPLDNEENIHALRRGEGAAVKTSEFRISAMCAKCQDGYYGEPDEAKANARMTEVQMLFLASCKSKNALFAFQ